VTPDEFRQIEQTYKDALTERADALKLAHPALSYRALAEIWGLTFSRVQQIVRGS
jgi:hypothetical protein